MRRTILCAVALAGLALGALGSAAMAATYTVSVADYHFTPARITVAQGDTVRWEWAEGSHTVTSGTDCRPDGRFNAPMNAGSPVFAYEFDEPGQVPYFCIPHCSMGMTGMVEVLPGRGAGPMSSGWRGATPNRTAYRIDRGRAYGYYPGVTSPGRAYGYYPGATTPSGVYGYYPGTASAWSAPSRSTGIGNCAACHQAAGATSFMPHSNLVPNRSGPRFEYGPSGWSEYGYWPGAQRDYGTRYRGNKKAWTSGGYR